MMKGKRFFLNAMTAAVMASAIVACASDDVFTERDALNNANKVLGIDIPAGQDWKMTQDVTANITVNVGTGGEYKVVVYDMNPFKNSDAVYFTKQTVSDGSVTKLNLSVPSYLTDVYVAIYDSNNHRRSKPAAITGDVADVIFGTAMEGSYSRVTRANPGVLIYPATHEYWVAGNLIAGANMNHNEWADPDKGFGGWVVPDTLTEGQKLRVQKYFQANPDLGYEDPHYRHFFVQQVYTGGTDAPETGNKEATVSADGQSHVGMTLNQLTVGEANSHINDFNAGTCTVSQVLDNGKTVNDATYHNDQITLMVNVYDTSCFGYHETSGSNTSTTNHNDKMALVSAATIDAWAAANGNPGEAVVDDWNRSFMGFDYELLSESEIALDSYAQLNQVQNLNNIPYAWDGQKVMTIGEAPESTGTTKNDDFDLFPYFALHASGNNNATCTIGDGKISCYFPQWSAITFGQGNQDWSPYSKLVIEFEESPINGSIMNTPFSIGDTSVEVNLNNEHWWGDDQGPTISTYDGSTGTLNITSVKLIGKTIEGTTVDPSAYYNPTYLLGDADNQKISFYSPNTNMYGGIVRTVTDQEKTTTIDGKTCLDLTFYQGLVTDGYHPITTDLQTWVKWQAACDGYYSDWIVTLTEAQRIDNEEEGDEEDNTPPAVYSYAFEDSWKADYDMNDVVLKVKENATNPNNIDVTLCCTGASYNLTVYLGNNPIFGGQEVHKVLGGTAGLFINTGSGEKFQQLAERTVTIAKPAGFTIGNAVGPDGFWILSPEKKVYVSTEGQDPHGIIIPGDWRWPKEWIRITDAYPGFVNFAQDPGNPDNAKWYKNPDEDKLY